LKPFKVFPFRAAGAGHVQQLGDGQPSAVEQTENVLKTFEREVAQAKAGF